MKGGRQHRSGYPPLSEQYWECQKNMASYPSSVTICCRIKRPVPLGGG